MGERCGIRHQIPEIVCVRPQGHDGPCWSKWERMGGGAIQRAEWWSEGGRFVRHHHYRAWYPTNAARRGEGGGDG